VIEAGGIYRPRLGHEWLANLLDQFQIALSVECERCASPENGFFGIWHLGELFSGQMIAVEWDDEGEVRARAIWTVRIKFMLVGVILFIETCTDRRSKRRFAGSWNAGNGNQETL
jgi:hypothetical protein